MTFFKAPILVQSYNPLDSLPTSSRAVEDEGNATVTVREVRGVGPTASGWAGIIFTCEIQVDGSEQPLSGGQSGVKGVDLIITLAPKGGGPINALTLAGDLGKLEERFGPAYAAAGHPLAADPDGSMITPGGVSLDESGDGWRSIEFRPFRAKVWTWSSKKGGRGVDFVAVQPAG